MPAQVELVNLTTADEVRLDGVLTRPQRAAALGLDAVILHHGVGGNFYKASFYEHMREALAEAGCAVLRVNNRGHDLAYNTPDGRLGAAFEVVADCRHDWKAWLDFAADRGFERIGVWGHSLGAVKTIYYLATERDPRVKCAIASSPPLFSYSHYLEKEGASRFREHMERAQRLVSAGTPEELFATTIPTNVILAARTYIDKYGPEERYNILRHIPRVETPLLVTIGSEEGLGPEAPDWFPFGGLAGKIEQLVVSIPQLRFQLVAGANHFYEGREAALWAVVRDWLARA
jgi:dipeptidyl aminopeptidase/acylaminoacyl peptidase